MPEHAAPWDLSREEFDRMLDGLLRAEGQVDVLNLSGGEPLLHPKLLDLVDAALARPEMVRVSISTNGLRFLREPKLVGELAARKVVVSLQFDGFEDRAYELLRGRKLLREKLDILKQLEEASITTSLTMTLAGRVNEDQLRPVLDYLFGHPHVVSLMLQPLAFAGRAARLKESLPRLTLPDVLKAVSAAGHPAVMSEDFLPLPCSHPLCFSLAFFISLEDGVARAASCSSSAARGAISVRRLAQAEVLADALANRAVFGLDPEQHERLKQWVYELWSGPAGSVPESESVLKALRGLLWEFSACACQRFDPRTAFLLTERRVKSIFIHAFQDAETFDLARARRCCNAYPQPDGRLLPACVRNNVARA